MESDINYPKSKAFNIFLRMLQLTLGLGCTIFVGELVEKNCLSEQFRIVEILIAAAFLISFIGLTIVKCSDTHPKAAFGIFLVLGLTDLAMVFFFALKEILKSQDCAITNVFYQYYIGAIALYALIAFCILVLPLLWVQRFTNSPGSLVWVFFFFLHGIEWKQNYRWTLIGLGGAVLLVSLITLTTNVIAGLTGITTCMKSTLKCFWIIDILLLVAVEVIVAFLFIYAKNDNQFSDYQGSEARTFLQTFFLVTLIDIMFWLYGTQTLEYQNGDSIRQDLVKFGRNPEFEDSEVHDYDPTKGGHLQQAR